MMMRIIEMPLLKRKPASGFDQGTLFFNVKTAPQKRSDDEKAQPLRLDVHHPVAHWVKISLLFSARCALSTSDPGKLSTGNINNICGLLAIPAH
jgi:hypothetical protein